MPVMDEFKEERDWIKTATPKQKYQYFKDYYRTPLILVLLGLCIAGVLIYHYVTYKDSAFWVAMINASDYEDNQWFAEKYNERAQIDLKKEELHFDTGFYFVNNSMDEYSYATVQKMETYMGAGELDVLMGGGEEFAYFANDVMLCDLRTILTPEQIEKYEPYFYYVEAFTDAESSAENMKLNPKDPSGMKNPVPVAIYVDSSEDLNKAYYFKNAEDGIAMGFFVNSSHRDKAITLLEFLMD